MQKLESLTKILGSKAKVVLIAGVLGTLSTVGYKHLEYFEGVRYIPYKDSVGVLTVCAGVTNAAVPGFVLPGKVYTSDECLKVEQTILSTKVLPALRKCIKRNITQGQLDSLVLLAWNIGEGRVCTSTVMRKLNSGDCYGAGEAFNSWILAGGKVLPGLVTRRKYEGTEFSSWCSSPAWK